MEHMKRAHDYTGFPTAEEAERAFYRAFANLSPDEMGRVWATDGVVCIHPGGPLLTGREAVLESWARILCSGTSSYLRYETVLIQASANLSIHVVRETFASAAGQGVGVVQAVNAYRRQSGGWRKVFHHAASPPPRTRQIQGKAVSAPPGMMQ